MSTRESSIVREDVRRDVDSFPGEEISLAHSVVSDTINTSQSVNSLVRGNALLEQMLALSALVLRFDRR